MKLHFKLTAEELIFMFTEVYLHSSAYRKVRMKSRFILACAVLMFAGGTQLIIQESLPSIILLIVGAVCVLFYPKIIKWTVKKMYKKRFKGTTPEPENWTLDSKKISVCVGDMKIDLQWDAFNEVHEYPDYYLLILKNLQKLLLPKSAFKDKKQENEAKTLFKKVPQNNC